MFTDQRRSLLSMLVGLAAIALFSGFASGADLSSNGLAAYDVTLTPNFITPNDPSSSNYQAVWLYGISPATPYISPDSYAHQGRYLLLDPRYTDSAGRPGRDDWWFIVQRYWPSSYQPSNHGNWGREVNFHNVAGDAGPGGGIGWSFGSGVSSLALDWLPGQNAPQFTVEPDHPNENMPLPSASRDTWHTYVVHFVAGRTDGTTPHAGAITVWADGSDVPAINATNIDTVQRAQGPDGNWYVQRWMQLWEGDYTQALTTPSTVRLTLTRIGGTLAQAMTDRPAVASTNLSGQFYSGSGTNAGAPSVRPATAADCERRRDPAEPRRNRRQPGRLVHRTRSVDCDSSGDGSSRSGLLQPQPGERRDERHGREWRRLGLVGRRPLHRLAQAQVAPRHTRRRAERVPRGSPVDRVAAVPVIRPVGREEVLPPRHHRALVARARAGLPPLGAAAHPGRGTADELTDAAQQTASER